MWWRLAARRGHAEAAARLAALAAEMTPAQVSEAEALATEFRARP
jgi:3,4-dihydroxy-2-butanone 4-phosphate synthase